MLAAAGAPREVAPAKNSKVPGVVGATLAVRVTAVPDTCGLAGVTVSVVVVAVAEMTIV